MGTPRKDYDVELEVMRAVRPSPEYTFTLRDIAEVCNVSPQAVRHVETCALHKVRRELARRGIMRELAMAGG